MLRVIARVETRVFIVIARGLIGGIGIDRKIVQQGLPHGVNSKAIGSNVCLGCIHCILGRNRPGLYCLRYIALAFIEEKEKGLVLNNRTADVGVELIVVDDSRLTFACSSAIATSVCKEIIGIANTTVIDPRRATVPTVSAALHA